MITAGRYKARAAGEVVLGESKEKRTPFVELYFEIVEGENAGGRVRWTSYFTDTKDKKGRSVAERTIEALQLCGWQGDDLADFADHQLHGLDANLVQIVVELEDYEKDGESRTSPRVKWVNRLGAGGSVNVENAMDVEDAARFADKYKGLVSAMRAKAPAPPGVATNGPGTRKAAF